MNLKLAASLLIIASTASVAQGANCVRYLSNINPDSVTISLVESSLPENEGQRARLEFAQRMIWTSFGGVGCSVDDLNFNLADHSRNQCKRIISSNPFSEACYLESEVGYFFVTRDSLDTVHVTWNRWD